MNEAFLQRIERTALVAGAALALVWATVSWWSAVALLVGLGLGVGNFRALRRGVAGLLQVAVLEGGGDPRRWGILLTLKFVAFSALLFVVVVLAGLPLIPLTIGLSLIVVALFYESFRLGPQGLDGASDLPPSRGFHDDASRR
jgi:hypothetical protein